MSAGTRVPSEADIKQIERHNMRKIAGKTYVVEIVDNEHGFGFRIFCYEDGRASSWQDFRGICRYSNAVAAVTSYYNPGDKELTPLTPTELLELVAKP